MSVRGAALGGANDAADGAAAGAGGVGWGALRRWGLGAGAVAGGVAVGLWRTRDPGAANSVWAEDGQNFLTDALTRPWYEALFTPFNGYFHTVARACWALIVLFPVAWAAALNAGLAALLTALLAAAVFGTAKERLGAAGAAVVAGTAAVPMGFIPNTLAQLQFPLVYAGLWMLLAGRGRVIGYLVPALAVLNSMLGVLLVPLAAARILRYRDRRRLMQGLVLVPGTLLQLVPWLAGAAGRGLGERPDRNPLHVALTYLRWGVPRSVLGPQWLAAPYDDAHAHAALVVAGLLVPVAMIVVAGKGWTRPDWRLAVVLAGFGALAGGFQLATHGGPEDRYLVLVALPNIAAGVALLRPGGRLAAMPLVVFATLLTVVCAANLRVAGPRDGIPAWDAVVAQARAECHVQPGLTRVTVHIAQWPVIGWEAVLPCARLR